MKIYDISQELTNCDVYPGDKEPQTERVCDMSKGALYNLTNLSLCVHNGTHIDAPMHFIDGGKSVSDISLEKFVGVCTVVHHEGDFLAKHAKEVMKSDSGDMPKRVLISGNATVTTEAARIFADCGIYLIGNESQTVGPEDAPMEVHKILLSKEVVLLEGLRLSGIIPGEYFLCAAPINIEESDGAPCRAILVKF